MHPRLTVALLLLMLLGCEDEGTGPLVSDLPIENVSFANEIQPIFTRSCARTGCHVGSNPQGGLNLGAGAAYDEIVDVDSSPVYSAKLVVPGSPDTSLLYRKTLSTSSSSGFGQRMPLGGPYLPEFEQATLRVWIEEGALDN